MGPWRWLVASRAVNRLDRPGESTPTPLIVIAEIGPGGVSHHPVRITMMFSPKTVRSMPSSSPKGRGLGIVAFRPPIEPTGSVCVVMDHHPKFEGFRFIGDKRTQLVYDLTTWDDDDVINEIADEGVGLGFGPDSLDEARNRGYTLATPGKRRRHLKPRA